MSPPVMIFGVYGHTGRFVLDELRRRGSAVVMSGRDPARLAELAVTGDLVRPAEVTDPGALSRAADGCAAILNCAGPFAETASPLVETALRLGIPYLGVAGEPGVVADIFARYDAPARERSIAVVPAAGFFGGLGDLLADAARGAWRDADLARVAIAFDRWNPTPGSRAAGASLAGRRWVWTGGALEVRSGPPPLSQVEFPPPFGTQPAMSEYPSPDAVMIPRGLATPQVDVVMALGGLAALRDPAACSPQPTPGRRSDQRFVVQANVHCHGEARTASAHGRDIYAITAPIVVEALSHALSGQRSGALSLSQLMDGRSTLSAISGAFDRLELP